MPPHAPPFSGGLIAGLFALLPSGNRATRTRRPMQKTMNSIRRRADISGAIAWATEPRSLPMLARRNVAFWLALAGPHRFGCSSLAEVAELKGIPEGTLSALVNELRNCYGIT